MALDSTLIETGATARLAEFTAALRYEDLPPAVVAGAKRLILDTVASAIGGHTLEAGRIVEQVAAEMGAGHATILGSGAQASAAAAAFANAYLGNVLDADDTFMNAGHPAACAVFPALALAETERLSGKALIAAVAAGFEVGARIGMSLVRSRTDETGKTTRSAQSGLGWYVFGAAAAAASALALDPGQAASAFGVAGFASPLGFALRWQQPKTGRNMMKYSPNGFLAFEGVVAAQLARRGFTGDPAIFDGDYAYWEMAGAFASDLDRQVTDLGSQWWVTETSLKPHAVGRFAQPAVWLLQQLIAEHGLTADEIEGVEVRTFETAAGPWFSGQRIPENPIDMQFSIPLALASVAHGLDLGPRSQTMARVTDPRINNFAAKVRVSVNPEAAIEIHRQMTADGRMRAIPNEVEVRARGRTFLAKGAYAKGDPWTEASRMTDADLRGKLELYAEGVLAPEKVRGLAAALFELEDAADVRAGLSGVLA